MAAPRPSQDPLEQGGSPGESTARFSVPSCPAAREFCSATYSREERERYELLARVADTGAAGLVSRRTAALLLKRSSLPDAVVRGALDLASLARFEEAEGAAPQSQPATLTRAQFLLACKVLAGAQERPAPGLDLQRVVELAASAGPPLRLELRAPRATLRGPAVPEADQRDPRPLVPGVGSPETGAYTTYLVTTSTERAPLRLAPPVRRRFSDFAFLHAVLRAAYPGLLVPALPPKGMAWSWNQTKFLAERRRQLDLFLKEIAAHPLLRDSLELQLFLSCSRPGLEAAKELLGGGGGWDEAREKDTDRNGPNDAPASARAPPKNANANANALAPTTNAMQMQMQMQMPLRRRPPRSSRRSRSPSTSWPGSARPRASPRRSPCRPRATTAWTPRSRCSRRTTRP